ncbi:hypothetical protein PFUM301598_10640 [Pseudomonas fluorescens]
MRIFRMCIIGIGIKGDRAMPVLQGGLVFYEKPTDTHHGKGCETDQCRYDHPVLKLSWDFFNVLNPH